MPRNPLEIKKGFFWQAMSRIAQKGQDITPIGKTSADTLQQAEEEEVFLPLHITHVSRISPSPPPYFLAML